MVNVVIIFWLIFTISLLCIFLYCGNNFVNLCITTGEKIIIIWWTSKNKNNSNKQMYLQLRLFPKHKCVCLFVMKARYLLVVVELTCLANDVDNWISFCLHLAMVVVLGVHVRVRTVTQFSFYFRCSFVFARVSSWFLIRRFNNCVTNHNNRPTASIDR